MRKRHRRCIRPTAPIACPSWIDGLCVRWCPRDSAFRHGWPPLGAMPAHAAAWRGQSSGGGRWQLQAGIGSRKRETRRRFLGFYWVRLPLRRGAGGAGGFRRESYPPNCTPDASPDQRKWRLLGVNCSRHVTGRVTPAVDAFPDCYEVARPVSPRRAGCLSQIRTNATESVTNLPDISIRFATLEIGTL